jgi:Cys-tRNA synthase (O-phospho-L-seryl-tRNA:Cys-tRNA synthase)
MYAELIITATEFGKGYSVIVMGKKGKITQMQFNGVNKFEDMEGALKLMKVKSVRVAALGNERDEMYLQMALTETGFITI